MIHKRLMAIINALTDGKHGLNVEEIAVKAKLDCRTVKLHLALMEYYNVGEFSDKKHKVWIQHLE